MGEAKQLVVKPIKASDANRIIRALHYSGKVVNNSKIHLGVFIGDKCGGAMQFGPSLDKRKIQGLVRGTLWNEFIELNRMAFADWLPRNSESRCIGYAMRWLRKTYPWLKWVVSFADGTQCGDGTIYRASGFVLTAITESKEMMRLPDGEVVHRVALNTSKGVNTGGGKYGRAEWMRRMNGKPVDGKMLRYIFFLDQTARDRLTVPVLPFSEIEKRGAGMYRGKPTKRAGGDTKDTAGHHPAEGGSTPTPALHLASQLIP